MDKQTVDNSVMALKMATEDHYRRQAACYRSSPEYNRMKRLYPVLQTYIEDCRDEKLIA